MKPNLSQSDSKRISVAGLETPHHKWHMLSSAQFDIRCGTIHYEYIYTVKTYLSSRFCGLMP